MAVTIMAQVTFVDARAGSGDPTHTYVRAQVTASDDSGASGHHFITDYGNSYMARGLTINEFNDAIIQGVLDVVSASTEATNNGWVVDRNNLFISGLFQRA